MIVNQPSPPSVDSQLAAEILQQGELLRTVVSRRADEVRAAAGEVLAREPVSWVVTGCGDSLFAGMCAEYWFADLVGLPLRASHALAFSRYLYRTVDPHSVVFAVSYSGNTARVVEAAVAARSRGACVVAVTANERSPLVELADLWLPNDATSERSNCRTLSFQATCALLHLFAAALAGAGRLHPGLPEAVERMGAAAEPIRSIAASLPDPDDVTVIGGGLGYPTACYGAAKLYEAATISAHAAELEQFIHCEIFPVAQSSTVVIVAAAGPSYERAAEVADALGGLGAVTVGISDEAAFADHVTHHIPLPDSLGEAHLPYVAAVPLQLLALELAARRGDNPDLVANKAVNRPLIESRLAWHASDYETTA